MGLENVPVSEPLVCANDAEAIEKAKRLVGSHALELWSGERFVKRLTASNSPVGNAVTHVVRRAA
jgi:hypothetical protein